MVGKEFLIDPINYSSLKKSSETHERFYPEKSLINQDMVIWDKHSVTFNNLGSGIISYKSRTT